MFCFSVTKSPKFFAFTGFKNYSPFQISWANWDVLLGVISSDKYANFFTSVKYCSAFRDLVCKKGYQVAFSISFPFKNKCTVNFLLGNFFLCTDQTCRQTTLILKFILWTHFIWFFCSIALSPNTFRVAVSLREIWAWITTVRILQPGMAGFRKLEQLPLGWPPTKTWSFLHLNLILIVKILKLRFG